jgi:hypothetical protein
MVYIDDLDTVVPKYYSGGRQSLLRTVPPNSGL